MAFKNALNDKIKMKIDLILNELLKKIEYSGLCLETINFKELDKESINRL